jgi:4-diphosphocytidyl-2-C-methyl-D-erythritol kinase
MIVDGFAKVNLSLGVRPRDDSGYHPIRSLAQSIEWPDRLALDFADEDTFTIAGSEDIAAESDNLAWRAVAAVRDELAVRRPLALDLEKRIPLAAGLGGGSADAAAGLVAAARLLDAPPDAARRLAPGLGSDVPFCLVGGMAWMEGRGERVSAIPIETDYALAVAVPVALRLRSDEVYRRWDDLDGPMGASVGGHHLPPSLRSFGPLGNDLLPAALDLRPELGDWMADMASRWGRPVLMTGSGSGVFGFFVDAEEAADAVLRVKHALVWAGEPVPSGTRIAVDE